MEPVGKQDHLAMHLQHLEIGPLRRRRSERFLSIPIAALKVDIDDDCDYAPKMTKNHLPAVRGL